MLRPKCRCWLSSAGRTEPLPIRGVGRIDVPSLRVDVIDSVGAGDTFDAGFLHQWVRKAPLETCVAFGNLAGGLSVTRSGGTEAFSDSAYRQSFFEQHWVHNTLVR